MRDYLVLAIILLGAPLAVFRPFLGILWWCWIRYRARSILATMIAHVASNSVAYTIAWFVTR